MNCSHDSLKGPKSSHQELLEKKGAYAALISDAYSAVRAEKSNNANIACFGAFTLGEKVMESLLRIWLSAEYQDGTPSAPKVQRIVAYENEAAHDQHQ